MDSETTQTSTPTPRIVVRKSKRGLKSKKSSVRSWDQVKLMKRVDRYFSNVCSKRKIKAILEMAKTRTTLKFKKLLEKNDKLYMHFAKLYGKKNFSPCKYGPKLEYTFNTNDTVTTTLSQLMFWKWCATYDAVDKYYEYV